MKVEEFEIILAGGIQGNQRNSQEYRDRKKINKIQILGTLSDIDPGTKWKANFIRLALHLLSSCPLSGNYVRKAIKLFHQMQKFWWAGWGVEKAR